MKMHLRIPPPVPDTSEERKANLVSAIASMRLEGLDLTESALEIFRRYAGGELAIEEMVKEVRALNAREFGPVPVESVQNLHSTNLLWMLASTTLTRT